MMYAVILAGGVGSRFWPLSTDMEPKQFLSVCSKHSMIEDSILRITDLIEKKNIYIATNKLYCQKVENCAKRFSIPERNILLEPTGKNTFAPIAVLSKIIHDLDNDAVILVMPCDHFIKQKNRFLRLLAKTKDAARQGYLVTLGVVPNTPQTGYGYIKIGPPLKLNLISSKTYKVDKFIEKPHVSLAKKFIKDKRYYWNSGIFIFKADVFLGETKRLLPQVYKTVIKIKDKNDLGKFWFAFPNISVDYAVMEKSSRLALFPVDFDWLDLGSWQAMHEILKKDKNGNIFRCKRHIDMGSRNTIVWSDNQLVATIGLCDVIVVNTKDALLICAKDKSQDIKKIVKNLKN